MTWSIGHKLQERRYRIEKILGEGGFGITYLAWDNHRADHVVIKTLNDDVQADPEFLKFQQDFLNEALRLAKCHHPHIVRIYELIEDNGLWGMVMEYLPGQTLAALVQHEGSLSESQALLYIRQIAAALIVVHAQGLLHRDIKPVNIMIRPDRQEAILIDFGLARDFHPNLEQHHTTYGTDGYAPIEQYRPMDHRGPFIDVYGLAATLYTLMTGVVPLCAAVRAIGRTLDTPRRLNTQISPEINAAILVGMALKPEDRPQTMPEWLTLLDPPQSPPQPTISEDPPLPLIIPSLRQGSREVAVEPQVLRPRDPSVPSPETYAEMLASLLHEEQWHAANQLTTAWLVLLSGRDPDQGGGFSLLDIDSVPSVGLHAIDQHWAAASQGRFGLRVQRHIYQQVQRQDERFGDRVGWRRDGLWQGEEELGAYSKIPAGHWPTGFFSGSTGGLGSALLVLSRSVFNRYQRCGL